MKFRRSKAHEKFGHSPAMKKLHEQDLIDVLADLFDCRSERAERLKEHIATGDFYPLHKRYIPGYAKPVKGVTGKNTATTVQIFPKDQWECPILSNELLPWPFLPTGSEIKETLQKNLKTQPWRFVPSLGSNELNFQAATELIESIPTEDARENTVSLSYLVKPDFGLNEQMAATSVANKGSIIHLQSAHFNALRTNRSLVDGVKGNLGESDFRVFVAPPEDVRETEHSEHYTVATLITGSQLWITFPYNDSNLSALRAAYEGLGAKTKDAVRKWEDVIVEMDSGVAFMQKAGETVVIPPFWPHLTMTVETSVCATFYVAKAVFFPMRMKNIGLWQLANSHWNDTELGQQHLVRGATSLLNHFGLVMRKEAPGVEESTRKELYTSWDLVKHSIYALCAEIADAKVAEKLVLGFKIVWVNFLLEQALTTRTCRICNMPVAFVPGPNTEYYNHVMDNTHLRERIWIHFDMAHWPTGDAQSSVESATLA